MSKLNDKITDDVYNLLVAIGTEHSIDVILGGSEIVARDETITYRRSNNKMNVFVDGNISNIQRTYEININSYDINRANNLADIIEKRMLSELSTPSSFRQESYKEKNIRVRMMFKLI